MIDLIKKEWLEERKTYLGGTDIASICGTTPQWRTAYDIFLEKTSKQVVPRVINEAMEIGILLEPFIVELYYRRTKHPVIQCDEIIRHSEYDFLAANIDRWVAPAEGKKFVLECKSSKLCRKKEW